MKDNLKHTARKKKLSPIRQSVEDSGKTSEEIRKPKAGVEEEKQEKMDEDMGE